MGAGDVERRGVGGQGRRLAAVLGGRMHAAGGRASEIDVGEPDVARRGDALEPRQLLIDRAAVPGQQGPIPGERRERGVGGVARALQLLDLAHLDRRAGIGQVAAQLVDGGALERARQVLAGEDEAAHASVGAADDPGRAVQALLDAAAALPGDERVVRRADRGLPVGQDVLIVEADQRHRGVVVLAEELQLGLARHVVVRRDDRRPLLPGDAVVGGEQADRGVEVLVAGGEQRPPVLAGLGVRALRVPPEAPERLRSGRVDVLIRPHRRGPRAPAVGRLGADGPRLTAQVAVVEARHAADRVEKQPAAHLDQLGIADVPTAGEVVRVHLAQQGERPPVVARLEDIDARPRRSDLALLTAPKHEQDAADGNGSSPCSRCAIRPSRRCAGRWRSWPERRRKRSRLRSGRSPARRSTTAFASGESSPWPRPVRVASSHVARTGPAAGLHRPNAPATSIRAIQDMDLGAGEALAVEALDRARLALQDRRVLTQDSVASGVTGGASWGRGTGGSELDHRRNMGLERQHGIMKAVLRRCSRRPGDTPPAPPTAG